MNEEASTLGTLIRGLRQRKGWTLRELSAHVGIPRSTLAKVEQDKLSLTYDKVQQFTSRLGLTMAEFLAQETPTPSASPAHFASPMLTARRSLTARSNTVNVSTPNYDYDYLCTDLREKTSEGGKAMAQTGPHGNTSYAEETANGTKYAGANGNVYKNTGSGWDQTRGGSSSSGASESSSAARGWGQQAPASRPSAFGAGGSGGGGWQSRAASARGSFSRGGGGGWRR